MTKYQWTKLLDDVYVMMLQVSVTDPARYKNQPVYARVRDALAELHGKDPETIQNEFENNEQ